MFTCLTQRETGHFHAVVVQRRQRNLQKKVINVQSCCLNSYLLELLSHLFRPVHRQMLANFLELNFKRLYQSSGKEREGRCLVFTCLTRREIKDFHVVVVERRQRNLQKRVMHVQSCCFANLNRLLFCRYRCLRCRRCVSSLMATEHAS